MKVKIYLALSRFASRGKIDNKKRQTHTSIECNMRENKIEYIIQRYLQPTILPLKYTLVAPPKINHK